MSTSVHPVPVPVPSPTAPHVLDNAAWAALTGPHAHLAERVGRAARYPTDVSPFTALADPADPRSWDDLAALVGPGVVTPSPRCRPCPTAGRPNAAATGFS